MLARLCGVLAVMVVTAACAPLNVCGETREPIAGARCAQSTDCPQTGSVAACVDDTRNEQACVLCASPDGGTQGVRSYCFRVEPVECR